MVVYEEERGKQTFGEFMFRVTLARSSRERRDSAGTYYLGASRNSEICNGG